jgi:hypothetical protein
MASTGGVGGGGNGSNYDGAPATAGTPNTGGGGGGGTNGSFPAAGAGGSGIVIIVYTTVGPGSLTFTKSATAAKNVTVSGTISKGAGTFVIDHPLDPRNKLLYHSFVESPEPKNIYDGVATLDERGEVIIELPGYFLALNKDFRYLASPIGEAMPNLHLAREVYRRRFLWLIPYGAPRIEIAGGASGGRISWLVSGTRQDAFVLAHPIQVEVEKGPDQLVNKGECIFAPLCD